jgi:hypothetical protein
MLKKELLLRICTWFFLGIILLTAGCASLNSRQQLELSAMQKADPPVYVDEKNPTTGIILGFLPGGGSFYTRQWGLGILDLLLWPLSIAWDPIAGYQGAQFINYDESKFKAKQQMKKELIALDDKKINKEITDEVYIMERRKVEAKYTFD